eukprot:scaffold236120_cov27-Tisochrysis_lutea.AAC.3
MSAGPRLRTGIGVRHNFDPSCGTGRLAVPPGEGPCSLPLHYHYARAATRRESKAGLVGIFTVPLAQRRGISTILT